MSLRQLHIFPESLRFGRALARCTGLSWSPVRVHAFPDGESLVRVDHREGREAVVVRSLHHPNDKILEVLLAADALRRSGARRVTLIAPYLPYMRQDDAFVRGEPVSQRVFGKLLAGAFDRVLTVEAHLHRVKRLADVIPGASARSVSAVPALAAWLRARTGTVLVGPDAESAPWIRALARVARLPYVVGEKRRQSDRRVAIRLPTLPAGRRAVLVDDIASSGATLAAAARALRRAGMRRIEAVAIHAIVAPGAQARLRRAGVTRLLSSDTVPHSSNAFSVAPLLAAALEGGR